MMPCYSVPVGSYPMSMTDWERIRQVLQRSLEPKTPVNILSVALYDLFGADGLFDILQVL